ncbi:protein DoxX [Dyella japonica A8]|uniref:Protein DoxX n=2 Tax=Dyella japonica TaxID=231455 RepID=A0A075K231_9GAMM|nr:DoxX family protein [Dyella japonica]AIF48289.1 protein DoxX [Dyella japonica A8]
MSDYYLLAGRIFIAFMFVLSGFNKAVYFQHGLEEVKAKNLPLPHLSLLATIVVQIVCGIAIMAGRFITPASLALAAFTLATAVVFYDFWRREGSERTVMFTGFLEHISIIGGFAILIGSGPGAFVL